MYLHCQSLLITIPYFSIIRSLSYWCYLIRVFFLSKFWWINYAIPGVFKGLHVCKCFCLPYWHMLSQVTTMGLQFCSLCKCLSPFFKVFSNILKSVLLLFPIYTWGNKAYNCIILPKSQNMIEPSSPQIPHPTLTTVLF